ncbi:unnamed protein product [Triticum turgidum subsp. durum]|uniref:Uncharacterized protein n=1 Tax=Triticum turgidum subsp. durum TaxID=4567 RepID=A0A9R1NZ55_TRITD|nr:unnamed protein product [Triticum turgidum subsp. durum]
MASPPLLLLSALTLAVVVAAPCRGEFTVVVPDAGALSSTVPGDFFTGLKALTTLVLSGMGLGGSLPESIGGLSQLRVLRLDGNGFTGVIPASFRRLEKASELRVDGNRLVGPIPFGKQMMWRLGKKLRVGGNEGLCYDAKQEGLEGAMALAGVADCGSVGSGATTQHLSWESSGGELDSAVLGKKVQQGRRWHEGRGEQVVKTSEVVVVRTSVEVVRTLEVVVDGGALSCLSC